MGIRNGDAVFIEGLFDHLVKVKHHIPIIIRFTPNPVLNIDRTIIQFDHLVNAGRALNTSNNSMLLGVEKFRLYTGCQLQALYQSGIDTASFRQTIGTLKTHNSVTGIGA